MLKFQNRPVGRMLKSGRRAEAMLTPEPSAWVS